MFKDRVFDIDLIEGEKGQICIHTSYEELSACADSFCDMCKFIRRELWYYHSFGRYYFRQFLESRHQKLSIHLLCGKPKWSQYPCWNIEVRNNSKNELLHEPLLGYPRLELKPQKAVETRGTNPTLRQTLELSRHWLATCKSEHQNCGPYVDEDTHFLPTRLLEVGSPGQKSIKLVLSKDISYTSCTDYVTLSYCWGTKRNAACTTQENLIEQMRAIPTAKDHQRCCGGDSQLRRAVFVGRCFVHNPSGSFRKQGLAKRTTKYGSYIPPLSIHHCCE
jgi:hypothetical protein